MRSETRETIYRLVSEFEREATDAARVPDINRVHYFVEQARKIQRLEWQINRRYPENNY